MGRIELRAFQDGDIALFQAWAAQGYVAKWYEHPQEWVQEMEARRGAFSWIRHFIAVYDGTDIHSGFGRWRGDVGFCQYYPYWESGEDWHGDVDPRGAYSIDYLLGDPACLGKGLGRELVLALLEAVRREPDARRVIARPDPDNAASCHTLLSAGFSYDPTNQLYLYTWEGAS